MAKEPGRKPAYRLSVLRKDNDKRGVVGAVWREDDGSISITINPCVVLRGDDDIHIKLFPIEWREPASAYVPPVAPPEPEGAQVGDDEVPFR